LLCESDQKAFTWGLNDTNKVQGSFGRLVANMEAKIVSDEGKELGPGELGELAVRGTFNVTTIS